MAEATKGHISRGSIICCLRRRTRASRRSHWFDLRQALVTAHEVGHTLGFPHAWNASMNDRASVMEYPSPRIKLTKDNKVDLSDAFQKQIGEFDKYMVRYSYTELPASHEKEGLEAIVHEMRSKGFIFTPATDPRWNRYDDLSDAATYLRETIKQRKVLLSGYGLAALQPGEDIGDLRGEGLWMTYLHHRWAIDSGVRYIGGQYHNYVVKGDSLPPTEIVPAAFQREILGLLTEALQPGELAIPESLLSQLTTDPYGGAVEESLAELARAPRLRSFIWTRDTLSAISPLLERCPT